MDFSKHIPAADSWLIKGAALPKNTSVDSESRDVGEGAQNSSIAVYAEVSGVTLAEGKKVSFAVKSSKDGTTWRTLHTTVILMGGRCTRRMHPERRTAW